jgi:hypothetical protein
LLKSQVVEELIARGHANILGTHSSTLEVTCAPEISQRANCVIGVNATKGLVDLSPEFKRLARSPTTKIIISFESEGKTEVIHAWGDSELPLSHERDMVIRTSNFVCSRTLAIRADKASADLNRALIQQLQTKDASLHIKIVAIAEIRE